MSRPVYRVIVSREDGYWIGEADGVPGAVVETRSLDRLEDEFRDGLALLLGVRFDSFDVQWAYDLPQEIAGPVEEYHRVSARLADAEREYAEVSRQAVRKLEAAHVSRRSAARLLGVSHQRVQQLARDVHRLRADA